MDRRTFLTITSGTLTAAALPACVDRPLPVRSPMASAIPEHESGAGALVNDLHSQLNPTRVSGVVKPASVDALRAALESARATGSPVCVAGGRHAMGGQQFAEQAVLIDTRALDRVLALDQDRGLITMEGGIQWPALLEHLASAQNGAQHWGIIQKQTGADRLSLAGALSCNAHGRGLALKPLIDQIDAFDLMDATGTIRTCSRDEHPELFSLAIGGYGLFGIITRVTLRLRPRVKVRRVVALGETAGIMERFEQRISDGYLYGDFQFATDATRDSFLRRGVFSCYEPLPDDAPLTERPTRFHPEDWARLTFYSHRYKRRAFEVYSTRYLATSGQTYWHDSQLSAAYVDDYHTDLDTALHAKAKGTEMITEIYVERAQLPAFMEQAAVMLRQRKANVIYGTVRLIERDEQSFLPWAKKRYACVIFNLHIDHTPPTIAAAGDAFRDLIDLGIAHGGSYYLTYHRWATKSQVKRCYPRLPEMLARKRHYDPEERFQSSWYRHYREMFGAG